MLASEVIWRALMRVGGAAVLFVVAACGVKVTVMGQVSPGRRVLQVLWKVKSGVVWRAAMRMVVVPVLVRVRVWDGEALPTWVEGR